MESSKHNRQFEQLPFVPPTYDESTPVGPLGNAEHHEITVPATEGYVAPEHVTEAAVPTELQTAHPLQIGKRLPASQVAAEVHMFAYDAMTRGLDPYSASHLIYEADTLAREPRTPEGYYRERPGNRLRPNDHIVTREQYVAAVRDIRADDASRQGVAVAAQALETYDNYETAVDGLLREARAEPHRVAVFGEGRFAKVMLLETGGEGYAVSVLHDRPKPMPGTRPVRPEWFGGKAHYKAFATIDKAIPMAVGEGVDGLAQLVTYNPHKGICVAHIVPGRRLHYLLPEDIEQMTPDDAERYGDMLATMADRNLYVDPNPANILWDADEGFGMVDYHRGPQTKDNTQRALELVVGYLVAKPSGDLKAPWVASPEKAAAALRTVRALSDIAARRFDISLPIAVPDLNKQAQAHHTAPHSAGR